MARPKTHIGTSAESSVPNAAKLGVYWRAQGRVPWQTHGLQGASGVLVVGSSWIVFDPPQVSTLFSLPPISLSPCPG